MGQDKMRMVMLTEDQYTQILFDLVELNRVAQQAILFEDDVAERDQAEKDIAARKEIIAILIGAGT